MMDMMLVCWSNEEVAMDFDISFIVVDCEIQYNGGTY